MKRWIRGEGKQPVTWKTLTDALSAIGLTELDTRVSVNTFYNIMHNVFTVSSFIMNSLCCHV